MSDGMQALLAAEAKIGVRPRILACPGLDNQDVAAALARLPALHRLHDGDARARDPPARAQTMNGPTLDFSFLDATARGSMASKHVDERFVSDRVNARSTTDAAF